ncbi:hypothetical protein [Allomuricauda sp. d1]|uniref:hypothetical protein n=1 Tax=Allomuricauda sp. d1 TaxID=3136725 RepID=UPI0031E0A163
MRLTKFYFLIFAAVTVATFVGCSNDDDTMAQVRVNGVVFDNGDDFNGDVDGDFTGNGGSATRTFVWLNNLTRADYNADITATAEGTFNMTVLDADGNTVLNRSLNGDVEPDSFSGVTDAGASGVWSVTITVDSFNGDGSFSLSEGD